MCGVLTESHITCDDNNSPGKCILFVNFGSVLWLCVCDLMMPPFDTLATLAGVLSSDEEMVCKQIYKPKTSHLDHIYWDSQPQVSLELGTLCKKYPDVTHEQLLCLLLLRGDLNKGWVFKPIAQKNFSYYDFFINRRDAKQLASEFVAEGATANKAFHAKSILSQVKCLIWVARSCAQGNHLSVSGCSHQHQFVW